MVYDYWDNIFWKLVKEDATFAEFKSYIPEEGFRLPRGNEHFSESVTWDSSDYNLHYTETNRIYPLYVVKEAGRLGHILYGDRK